MSVPCPFTEAEAVADFFGDDHPFVKMFNKTGWAPDFLILHYTLDGEVLEVTDFGENEYPNEILKADDWPSEEEYLQKTYGISAEDVERVEHCF